MRYEKGHKETTRRRILETASARFRKDGIESVGVADLMAEAGLTHGGFYSHFPSKEGLVQAAVEDAGRHSVENFHRRMEEGGLEGWIRNYLRLSHRDHPERGCVAAALAGELGRHPAATRAGFSKGLVSVFGEIEKHLPSRLFPIQRRQRAMGIFSIVAGALQMARAVDDERLSEEILEAGIASALALIDAPVR